MDEFDGLDIPPRRRPTRGQAARRRLVAFAVILALAAGGTWAAVSALGSDSGSSTPTTTAAAPPRKTYRIVFPEGFTRRQMAQRVGAVRAIARDKRGFTPKLTSAGYLRATASSKLPATFKAQQKQTSAEGFLFPATYELFEDDTAARLLAEQEQAFARAWKKVGLGYARSKNLTPYDVLIIASMVEKEVVVASERKLVAAVIYNRLKRQMPLGIDATLRYGLNIPPTKAIRRSQLDSDSPYNTSKRPGLPPTPIANPGLPSMQAAAHPADVDYLFFIRKPDCKHHFFTASESEFLNYTREGLRCKGR
jgi:UPF0755 protein